MAVNLQRWARLTRIDLQALSVEIGNAAMRNIQAWPPSGEGRAVKASTEQMLRLLDSTHDRSHISHAFGVLENVMGELQTISDNAFFKGVIAGQRSPTSPRNKPSFGEIVEQKLETFRKFANEHRPEPEALLVVDAMTAAVPLNSDRPEPGLSLTELTPSQQPGPLQFEFVDGMLRIKRQTPAAAKKDLDNIRSARYAILQSGDVLLSELSESNCDRRLFSTIDAMQGSLRSDENIIALGIFNLTCDRLITDFEDELPIAIGARLKGYSTGIGLYVGQFPEWQQFAQNAAQVDFELSDVRRASEVGAALVPVLEEAPSIVDPEVPRSIQIILSALSNPGKALHRALFAAVRTLENLLARVFTEFGGILSAASEGVRTGVKNAVSIGVSVGLLAAAAGAASGLSPTAERVVKAAWMKKAADLVAEGLTKAD